MRNRTILALAAVAATVACSGSDRGGMADDLKRDLEASSSSLELAGQGRNASMQVVSELEQGKVSEPVERARAPRPVAANTTGLKPEDKTTTAPEPQNEVQVSQVSEAPQAPAPAPDAPTVPMVAPRPASLPVDVPSEGVRGQGDRGVGTEGTGIGIGDVIGVVIRGGGVGPDHCPPRRRGRGRPIILP